MGGRRNGQLDPTTGLRRCISCVTVKPLTEFGQDKKTTWFYSRCKTCSSNQSRAYYAVHGANKNWPSKALGRIKQANRKSRLKTAFGLTPEAYATKLAAQNGCCAICNTPQTSVAKAFAVDHNHVTKVNRDLLCHKCNTGLGLFKENEDFLQIAIAYLRRHGANI